MGVAGNVYAFDPSFQGGVLVGDLDEVQPSPRLQDSDLLQSIQQTWIAVRELMHTASYCAYERLPTDGVFVVSQASARGLCNKPLEPITEDHIDLVKPTSRDDPRYTRFVTPSVVSGGSIYREKFGSPEPPVRPGFPLVKHTK